MTTTKYRVTWNVGDRLERGSFIDGDRAFVQTMADSLTRQHGMPHSVEAVEVDDDGNATAADGHTVDKWSRVTNTGAPV